MSDLERVRERAEELIRTHLDPARWSFGFDTAKTRAGQCDFHRHRITVSRYLAARFDDDAIEQVLLHEVAHALVGARVGHGAAWLRTARGIGYSGSRLHDGPIASDLAPWVGHCPAGHEHFRYRRPTRPMACGRCSRRYDARHAITWSERQRGARAARPAGSAA